MHAGVNDLNFCPITAKSDFVGDRIGQNSGFGPVPKTAVKFVQSAGMVEMAMGDDGFNRLFRFA